MSATRPRVAILGLHLEANGFAPLTVREDFLRRCWEEGEAISHLARQVSHLPSELPGFYARMDATGPWTPVPVLVASAPPGGPIVQDLFLRRGVSAGKRFNPGPSALLEMHGIDIAAARCVVVKSRGHFRAGFDEFFPPEQVFEVDTPGPASPILGNFTWQGLPRPVFPLDPDTQWQQPAWA